MTVGRAVIVPPRCRPKGLEVPNESIPARLERAKGYPYPRPASSFVFINGAAYALAQPWAAPEQLLGLHVRAVDTSRDADHHSTSHNGSNSSQGGNGSCGTNASTLSGNRAAQSIRHNGSTGSDGGQHGSDRPTTMTIAEAAALHGIDAAALLPHGTSLTPVLAIGSNAAPSQLARKFTAEACPQGAIIPVIQAVLEGFVPVYAPLISSYGSVTATLEAAPGASSCVFITYLTPSLQARMHETEGAYNLCRLNDIRLHVDTSLTAFRRGQHPQHTLDSIFQYNHQHGTLHLTTSNGTCTPVALAEIPAHGCSFPALTQVQMQMAVRHALGHKQAHAPLIHAGMLGQSNSALNAAAGASVLAADLVASGLPATQQTNGSPSDSISGLQPVELPLGPADTNMQLQWMDEEGLDDWILSNLTSPKDRKLRVARLAAAAQPFNYNDTQILLTLGNMFSANVK